MFTGIIENVARVARIEEAKLPQNAQNVMIRLSTGFSHLDLGESIAVNGVCLTVTEFSSQEASFFIGPDTLSSTQLGTLRSGDLVNLERAMPAQGRFSGHIVQGHVDGVAEIVEVQQMGESHHLSIKIPQSLSRYCILKGSICINGVSLTIQSLSVTTDNQTLIKVMIIPHTWFNTNFSHLKVNDRANVEVDLISKYVERLCQPH